MEKITAKDISGNIISNWRRNESGDLIKFVIQEWIADLSLMQQTVLLTSIRGPDTIQKEHPAKVILRWYRRCILFSAMDGIILKTPYVDGGGSFTGKCNGLIEDYVKDYFKQVDELPHHFQMHLMHASEILGYKHPDKQIRTFWFNFYQKYVKSLHLNIETEKEMDFRLGDNESNWKSTEI